MHADDEHAASCFSAALMMMMMMGRMGGGWAARGGAVRCGGPEEKCLLCVLCVLCVCCVCLNAAVHSPGSVWELGIFTFSCFSLCSRLQGDRPVASSRWRVSVDGRAVCGTCTSVPGVLGRGSCTETHLHSWVALPVHDVY